MDNNSQAQWLCAASCSLVVTVRLSGLAPYSLYIDQVLNGSGNMLLFSFCQLVLVLVLVLRSKVLVISGHPHPFLLKIKFRWLKLIFYLSFSRQEHFAFKSSKDYSTKMLWTFCLVLVKTKNKHFNQSKSNEKWQVVWLITQLCREAVLSDVTDLSTASRH